MATPAFSVTSINSQVQCNTPSVLNFQCNDVNGLPVDISVGYTAALVKQQPTDFTRGNQTTQAGTWTFSNTGVATLTMTAAQTQAIPANTQIPVELKLSNDAFATYSIAGLGTLAAAQSLT
jgi:hypothetical protein